VAWWWWFVVVDVVVLWLCVLFIVWQVMVVVKAEHECTCG
jgi:hypothetical protein